MAGMIKIDSWGDASVTYDGEVPIEASRVAHVIGLLGPDSLMDAVETVNIPRPWDVLPGRTFMRALTYSVTPTSGTTAEVLIRYVNVDYLKIRGGNAPETVQKDYDVNNNAIVMTFNGQQYRGVVNVLAPRPVKTIQQYRAQIGYANGIDIDALQATYQGCVVTGSFFGRPTEYWFLEAIDYDKIGGVAYDITWTFRGRPVYPATSVSGWFARTIPEDENGNPVVGATPTYSQVYPGVTVSALDLEP